MMQWDEMQCISSLLPSNPIKESEGCNHIVQFNMRCCTGTYRTNIRLWCLLMHTKGECKNITIDDKVYYKISKINFIYLVIQLIWILKLNGGNSNNEWKLIDHDTTFICLLQLSIHKAKHDPKEHHLITNKIQH
jgi:hypothetical protein